MGKEREARGRVGKEKVGRDCEVLKIPKPWSWTLANFETDRRPWSTKLDLVQLSDYFRPCWIQFGIFFLKNKF